MLMLLHGSGDVQVDQLRRDALAEFAHQVLESLGIDQSGHDDVELRAQLVITLGVGVAVLRSGVELQPLCDADPEALESAIRSVIDALVPPPPSL